MAAFKDRRFECDTKTTGGLLWKSSGFVSQARAYATSEVTTSFLTYLIAGGTAREREGVFFRPRTIPLGKRDTYLLPRTHKGYTHV